MTHFDWIMKAAEQVICSHRESESIFFIACGELCCEINGEPMLCSSPDEFWEMVEFFKGETFEE